MKIYLQLSISCVLAFFLFGAAGKSHAQANSSHLNYEVVYDSDCYTPLEGSTLIQSTDFLNFTGAADADDGTANSIPVGFTFEYNGVLSNSVNVNVNGWVTINPIGKISPNPVTTSNNNALFTTTLPNNTLAPYWGDHYYRTLEAGYKPTRISYLTAYVPFGARDTNSPPFTTIGIFTVEWKDLNINDKSNPKSAASFQLIIRQNPRAWDRTAQDQRAIIEFRYGPADTAAVVAGASVGIEDSLGFTHLNGLFESSQFNGDSSRLSTARTTCWPPPNCTPCVAIEFVPVSQLAAVTNSTTNYSLEAYPNPFTQAATISFHSATSGQAQITILNLLGVEVARLYNGELSAGDHSFTWDARGTAPGMYEWVVRAGGESSETPIVLLR